TTVSSASNVYTKEVVPLVTLISNCTHIKSSAVEPTCNKLISYSSTVIGTLTVDSLACTSTILKIVKILNKINKKIFLLTTITSTDFGKSFKGYKHNSQNSYC